MARGQDAIRMQTAATEDARGHFRAQLDRIRHLGPPVFSVYLRQEPAAPQAGDGPPPRLLDAAHRLGCAERAGEMLKDARLRQCTSAVLAGFATQSGYEILCLPVELPGLPADGEPRAKDGPADLAPLALADLALPHYGVLCLGSDRARVFSVFLGDVRLMCTLHPGSATDFLPAVAAEVEAQARRWHMDVVLLMAPASLVASFTRAATPRLAELLHTSPLPDTTNAPGHDHQSILAAVAQAEGRREEEALQLAWENGVSGTRNTTRAINAGRAETVLAPIDSTEHVYLDPITHKVAGDTADAVNAGIQTEAIPLLDALTHLAAHRGLKTVLLHGRARHHILDRQGGLAASLRW